MAFAVDRGLKPSLSAYGLRASVDQTLPLAKELEHFLDGGHSLLEAINQEVDLAAEKQRRGQTRAALASLRKAQRLVRGAAEGGGASLGGLGHHGGASASRLPRPEALPAPKLALATVRLRLAATLTELGLHAQAFGEVRDACFATDELWETLLAARRAEAAETQRRAAAARAAEGEDEEGDEELACEEADDFRMPPSPSRAATAFLARAPVWLEQAVVITIEARKAFAAAAATLQAAEQVFPVVRHASAPSMRRTVSVGSSIGARSPVGTIASRDFDDSDWDDDLGATAKAAVWDVDVEGLNKQALALARQLLPEAHELRRKLESEEERAEEEARETRRAAREFRRASAAHAAAAAAAEAAGDAPPPPPPEPEHLKRKVQEEAPRTQTPSLPQLLHFRDVGRLPTPLPSAGKPPGTAPAGAASTLQTTATSSSPATPGGSSMLTRGGTAPCTPGDVYFESLPRRRLRPSGSPKARRSPPASGGSGDSSPVLGSARARSPPWSSSSEKRTSNPFQDWKDSRTDVNRMTYRQMCNLTLEGQTKVKNEFKRESLIFKMLLHPIYPDDWHWENRIFYSEHGKKSAQRAEVRKAKYRESLYSPSEQTLRRLENEKFLFRYYNIPLKKKEPDLKTLKKLLTKSMEMTPMGRSQQKARDEERRRQEAEEKAARMANFSDLGAEMPKAAGNKEGTTAEAPGAEI
eukprot:TRINITY_DN3883_c0_g1_i2.p1 TRINITY_DN3883_c0_g1~~TRINITY_DN3883_c0_g1_i2.p1  ORF type:complete len:697 (+),score=203.02 TRINITY_DN3883_c0_g1_i2:70-2160(+)